MTNLGGKNPSERSSASWPAWIWPDYVPIPLHQWVMTVNGVPRSKPRDLWVEGSVARRSSRLTLTNQTGSTLHRQGHGVEQALRSHGLGEFGYDNGANAGSLVAGQLGGREDHGGRGFADGGE